MLPADGEAVRVSSNDGQVPPRLSPPAAMSQVPTKVLCHGAHLRCAKGVGASGVQVQVRHDQEASLPGTGSAAGHRPPYTPTWAAATGEQEDRDQGVLLLRSPALNVKGLQRRE
mmetsp:Transcript_30681/g.89184  ORF Transcript_30681/g.89184 Transcript_30681/m.89184 type:complete len:114 (+) Transcript_30681:391-732(+)